MGRILNDFGFKVFYLLGFYGKVGGSDVILELETPIIQTWNSKSASTKRLKNFNNISIFLLTQDMLQKLYPPDIWRLMDSKTA